MIGFNYTCKCVGNAYGDNCEYKKLNSTIFVNSTILTEEKSFDLVNLLKLNNTSFKLLYQSSKDGVSASEFHAKCDGASGTLTVLKSQSSNIFGGYTAADWSGWSQYKNDPTAFLFSLVNSYNVSIKMNIIEDNWAIYCYPTYGITFGSGYDLNCDNSGECFSSPGRTFQLPSFLQNSNDSREAMSFLAGTYYRFKPVEIEVYAVIV